MIGSSVICVLIGKETHTRHWVNYEILHSIERGMGVFGVRINGIPDFNRQVDAAGSNPFNFLRYTSPSLLDVETLNPQIRYETGWKSAPRNESIKRGSVKYFANTFFDPELSDIFKTYDWVTDNGYSNFGAWVTAAAIQAGK